MESASGTMEKHCLIMNIEDSIYLTLWLNLEPEESDNTW